MDFVILLFRYFVILLFRWIKITNPGRSMSSAVVKKKLIFITNSELGNSPISPPMEITLGTPRHGQRGGARNLGKRKGDLRQTDRDLGKLGGSLI